MAGGKKKNWVWVHKLFRKEVAILVQNSSVLVDQKMDSEYVNPEGKKNEERKRRQSYRKNGGDGLHRYDGFSGTGANTPLEFVLHSSLRERITVIRGTCETRDQIRRSPGPATGLSGKEKWGKAGF